jgi:hypothetical protein
VVFMLPYHFIYMMVLALDMNEFIYSAFHFISILLFLINFFFPQGKILMLFLKQHLYCQRGKQG